MLLPAAAALVLAEAGCTSQSGAEVATAPPPATTSAAPTSASAPPDPEPAKTASCPYLETAVVAKTNGQRVGTVRLSAPPADTPPTCFFYRDDGRLQMTVRPFVGDVLTARAAVNAAAPVATSNRASDPAGWEGGYEARNGGAVYAVADGHGRALVVTTNQHQSVKAKEIALDTIDALGW
jgi:hypothetical protein